MNRYVSRLTSSSRGETFNVLAWLFLIPTFVAGFSLAVGVPVWGLAGSAVLMYDSFNVLINNSAVIWGILAMVNIVMGATFLMFNFPPFGKASGIVGFMLWIWAGFCFMFAGLYMMVGVLALPQALFWIWQYFTLSRFRHEEALDRQTMRDYNDGGYDDQKRPWAGKAERRNNRGKDWQSNQTYDSKDNGRDSSRHIDV